MRARHIEASLEAAWATLGGRARCFSALPAPPVLRPDDILYELPVSHVDGMPAVVVMLMLAPADAKELAGSMFGRQAGAISAADLQDAAAELCNIFSACLIDGLDHPAQSEQGLPQPLSPWRYESLLKAGMRQAYQCLGDPKTRLAVLLFNPVAEPS